MRSVRLRRTPTRRSRYRPLGDQPTRLFRWGTQLDVRPVKAFGDGSDITEQAVASYVAKYSTKAAENTGTLDRRIGELAELDRHGVPDHTRRLITACRNLDPLYPDRRLWAWAHMLGFRGHFSSKSRHYSTTLGALRQARADYRAAQDAGALGLDDREPETVLVLADWQYAGHGHTPGESALAATIARDIRLNRETAREALRDRSRGRGGVVTMERLLTVDQVAERLGTGVRFARRLVEERRIRYVKVGRHVRIPESAVRDVPRRPHRGTGEAARRAGLRRAA
ncbi:hypothetical protein STENM223S_07028 [Streptomyces tendae]